MLNNRRVLVWDEIPLDNYKNQKLVDQLIRWSAGKTTRSVYYVNIHQLRLFKENQKYRRALLKADLVYPDGEGAVLAARLTGHVIHGRLTAADFYPELFGEFVKEGARIFLLGGEKKVIRVAGKNIKTQFPGLKIVGQHHGYFQKNSLMLDRIKKSTANVLLVGMGSPKQEIWVEKNKSGLKGIGLIWAVGGLFNYWAGNWQWAPGLIVRLKLEWLYRCFREPNRLATRYIKDLLNLIHQAVFYKISSW